MSATNYYTDANGPQDNIYYPDILDIVLKTVKYYIFNLLYKETPTTDNINKRFVLADMESGDEVAIRRSIETFFNTNATFPFTAYNINDEEEITNYSYLQKTGSYYVSDFGAGVAAIPYEVTIPMVTFYNTPFDWRRNQAIFGLDAINLNRIWCPCTLNGILTQFPINIKFEITKGSFAFRYDEMLKTGQIYDVKHDMKISYNKYILVQSSQLSSTGRQTALPLFPVDDIQLSLTQLNDKTNLDSPSNYSLGVYYSPDTPSIVSTAPVNNETNVDKSLVVVIITFNVSMDEAGALNSFDVIPYFEHTKSLSLDGKTLLIDPVSDLTASTQYEIFVNKNIKSTDGVTMEADYSLKFTTGL
jgi:hypothetical protein